MTENNYIYPKKFLPEKAGLIKAFHLANNFGHSSAVSSIVITPDGKNIISGSFDQTIKIWDFETGDLIKTLDGHAGLIYSVILAPDGKHLLSGSMDVKIWNLETGQKVKDFRGLEDSNCYMKPLSITPDGKYVICSFQDDETSTSSIQIWYYITGTFIRKINTEVYNLTITSNKKYIISAPDEGGTISIWDFKSGKLINELSGHRSSIRGLVVTPDNKYLVSGSKDKTIKIWNLSTGSLIKTLYGHKEGLESVILSPDGKYIISYTGRDTSQKNSEIIIWKFDTGQIIQTIEHKGDPIYSIAITLDGNYIVCGTDKGQIRIWKLSSGDLIRIIKGYQKHKYIIDCIGVMDESKVIFTFSHDKLIRTLNLDSGKIVKTWEERHKKFKISLNGCYMISVTTDNTIKIWDLLKSKLMHLIGGKRKYYGSLVISPSSKYLLCRSSNPNSIEIIDINSEKTIKKITRLTNSTNCAFFSDERYFISCGYEKELEVWDLFRGELVKTLEGTSKGMDLIAISPNDKYIIGNLEENKIYVWEAKSGKLIIIFEGHEPHILEELIFSPNGKYFASASRDNSIRVWNIEDNCCYGPFYHHSDVITISFIPKTNFIVAGDNSSDIIVWDYLKGNKTILKKLYEFKQNFKWSNVTEFRSAKITRYEAEILRELEAQLGSYFDFKKSGVESDKQCFSVKNYKITGISIPNRNLLKIPKLLFKLKNLSDLRLEHNFFEKISFSSFNSLERLKSLSLSHNRIREIKDLSWQINLKELNLSHNMITDIVEIDLLWVVIQQGLKVLDLSYNKISEIKGLYFGKSVPKLERLNLSQNNYNKIKGLEYLENLKNLYVDIVRVPKIEGLQNLKNLNELYFNYSDKYIPILKKLGGIDTKTGRVNDPQKFVEYCREQLKEFHKEFKVNDYITLKLIDDETVVFINNKKFIDCKYLLLNISDEEVEIVDDIKSIDEAAEKLGDYLHPDWDPNFGFKRKRIIPSEVEFWGHCSNLQAWYELDYDTRILHRNIAFPLLKKLTEVGDRIAKKVFQEEIAYRIESGHPSVIVYLVSENYFNYLSQDYIKQITPKILDYLIGILEGKDKRLKIHALYSYIVLNPRLN